MKKIAIIPRIDKFGKHNEIRDNLDVRFISLIEKLGFVPILIPTKIKKIELYLNKISPDGVILSPGGNPLENNIRRKNEYKIIKYSIKKKIPILGICRGAQVINLFFNGKLKKINNHVRKNHQIFGKLIKSKKIITNSFHDLGFDKKILGKNLVIQAYTKDQIIESFSHKKYKVFGLMWHPERYKKIKQFDRKLLKSFF